MYEVPNAMRECENLFLNSEQKNKLNSHYFLLPSTTFIQCIFESWPSICRNCNKSQCTGAGGVLDDMMLRYIKMHIP